MRCVMGWQKNNSLSPCVASHSPPFDPPLLSTSSRSPSILCVRAAPIKPASPLGTAATHSVSAAWDLPVQLWPPSPTKGSNSNASWLSRCTARRPVQLRDSRWRLCGESSGGNSLSYRPPPATRSPSQCAPQSLFCFPFQLDPSSFLLQSQAYQYQEQQQQYPQQQHTTVVKTTKTAPIMAQQYQQLLQQTTQNSKTRNCCSSKHNHNHNSTHNKNNNTYFLRQQHSICNGDVHIRNLFAGSISVPLSSFIVQRPARNARQNC